MPPLYLWYNVNVGFSGADFEIPEPEFRIIGWCGQILNCAARPVRRQGLASVGHVRQSSLMAEGQHRHAAAAQSVSHGMRYPPRPD